MRVGYYQNNAEFGKVAENVDRIAAKLEDAEADLLVLPELCASGYQFVSMDEVRALAEPIPAGQTTKRLLDLAKRRQMVIVAGVPEQAGTAYYNSAVVVAPQGFIGSYRKTHLFFRGDAVLYAGRHGLSCLGYRTCQDRRHDLFRLVLSRGRKGLGAQRRGHHLSSFQSRAAELPGFHAGPLSRESRVCSDM